MISDVEGGFVNDPYRIFQSLLTKSPNSSNDPDEPLTFNDMVESLMMEYDATFACTQLFVKVSFNSGRYILLVKLQILFSQTRRQFLYFTSDFALSFPVNL